MILKNFQGHASYWMSYNKKDSCSPGLNACTAETALPVLVHLIGCIYGIQCTSCTKLLDIDFIAMVVGMRPIN
jgi:hypothetical protein